jgi:D-alanyl-D-alanine carboxypeptidase/D-alanyl-D-alanine-endopeptidase (penicillin-binding protein 4)
MGYKLPMLAKPLTRSVGTALLSCAVLCGAAGSAAAQSSPPISKAENALRKTLAGDLALAGGSDSALVVDGDTGQVLFSASPRTGRLPASVEKLWTTTTTLLEFGPNATLSTSVLGVGALQAGGVWRGTLYLRGGGDPTFGSASFDDLMYGDGVGATVQQLAASVADAGIRQVDGAVIGDESEFDTLRGTPATGYGADLEVEGELSALAYDDGFESADEVSLQPDPAQFAAQQLVGALRADGVSIRRGTPTGTGLAPAGARLLARVQSPPIGTLIKLTNTPSDNFFAETLLKDLGVKFGRGGTTAGGAAVVSSFIASRFDLHPRLDDGSGLSRYDRTSAAEVVSLLEQMQPDQSFINSLAIAGVSGTMQDEMLGTRAVGNCRGKTGTLHDVANLAGYCTARNGDTLVFTFLLNSQSDSTYGHEIDDRMGVALADYDGPPATKASGPATKASGPARQVSGAGAPI